MSKASKLRSLINSGTVFAPNAYDALSAILIQEAGFKAVSTSSANIHVSSLGTADFGLLSFSEMLEIHRNMANAVEIPLFADAADGYGNALNVIRTVKAFEQAGAAGICLEDQQRPTSCPHVKALKLISSDEMCGKIRAAKYSAEDPDLVIIARTDADFHEACDRANAYLEAGADVVKIQPKTRDELMDYPKRIAGPLYISFNEGKNSRTAGLTLTDLSDIGYRVVTFPTVAMHARIKAEREALRRLMEGQSYEAVEDMMITLKEKYALIGRDRLLELSSKYSAE